MSFAETVGKELVQAMTTEERKHFADTLLAEFLRPMTREERKEMLYHILPFIIDESLSGMTIDEKKGLILRVVDLMQSNLKNSRPE
jgi:hypothetical protein